MTWDDKVSNNYPKDLKLTQFRHHFHPINHDPTKNVYGKGKDFAFVTLILHLERLLNFLSLITMNNTIKNSMPKLSYMTFMDIWMTTCVIFVFCTNLVSICEMVMIKSGKSVAGIKLNRGSKIIIPSLFLLFNAVYWPIILTSYFKDKTSVEYHVRH